MTVTEQFFVECVKKGIKEQKVENIPEGVDYRQLYRLCSAHSMSVIVCSALENVREKAHGGFINALDASVQKQVLKDVQSEYDIKTVFDEFEKREIKFMPLKGYHLKKLYPSSDMRYASDCDVLIDVNQLDLVRRTVKELGLEVKRYDEHHDIVYYPETKTVFELHKMLFVGKLGEYFGVGFERAKPVLGYKSFYRLENEDFYVSILAHSAYHFAEGAGVGIRHLTDIYVYKKAYNLNEEYLTEELSKCGLLKFKEQFEKVAEYFFEDKTPDEFTQKLAKHILESSILANEGKLSASEVASNSSDDGGSKAKRRTIFRMIFPPKENMKFSYPVLKKHGWLLPLFYPIRWFHVILTRPKNVGKLKKVNQVESDQLKYMREIRTGLGINDL